MDWNELLKSSYRPNNLENEYFLYSHFGKYYNLYIKYKLTLIINLKVKTYCSIR